MSDRLEYIVDLPGGGVMDTRLRFGRDDRVRITQGPHAGRTATVESLLGCWIENSRPQIDPGYNLILDGVVVSVRWDWVARV